jgi:hypothetical protein
MEKAFAPVARSFIGYGYSLARRKRSGAEQKPIS